MVHKMKPAQPSPPPPIHTAFLVTDCFDFMAGKYLVSFPSVVDTLSSGGSVEAADSLAAKEASNSLGGGYNRLYIELGGEQLLRICRRRERKQSPRLNAKAG